MISGVNHITLAVSNLTTSLEFYCDLLGCNRVHTWARGAYLEAGGTWICLAVCDAIDERSDYSHLAFDASPEGFESLASKFDDRGVQRWKENRSEGDSIYFLDPDGHRLEIHIGSLGSRMSHIDRTSGS